ncbi:MAG TPA: hypothetical protein GXX75_22870 [Clostridiales bacterium]|nr:hypothetical protein [Clostridiales bacterium]
MKQNRLKKMVLDAVSEKTYSNEDLVQMRKVITCIPEMFNAVEIDKRMLKKRMEGIIDRSGNSLNSILKYLELKLVKGRKLEWEYDNDQSMLDDLIVIDAKAFHSGLDHMIHILSDIERKNSLDLEENEKSLKELFREKENLNNKINQINLKNNIYENKVLERLQHIISLEYFSNSKSGETSQVYIQIREMLEDMGIQVVWSGEGEIDEGEIQVFKTQKEREYMGGKPCFKRGTEVVLRGMKYQLVSGDSLESETAEE